MKIFLTGATGFIGSAIVPELLHAGHQVLGLTRSAAGAEALRAAGAEPHSGDLEDLAALSTGASQSDAVLHCAFVHDFSKFQESCEIDRRAIETLGDALAGSNRSLIVSSGLGRWAVGRPIDENDHHPADSPLPRVSEPVGLAQSAKGVKAAVIRLPQVHDTVKQGFVTYLIAIARQLGFVPCVGEGANHWPAAHIADTARLYRLALEQNEAGARYHAVAEQGVRLRDIADAIARGLNLPVVSITPEEAAAKMGFLGHFAAMDITASSDLTQHKLGWHPTGPTMLEDLNNMNYSL